MSIPEKIRINREEDYHTHYLGKTADGRKQFFGCQTFVFPNGMPQSDWQNQRREYVVLYQFDLRGNHIETKHWFAGTASEANDETSIEMLEKLVNELGEIIYTDIVVKPFEVKIDGYTFGLIPNNEQESIDLQPSSTISFQYPWDGEYYT